MRRVSAKVLALIGTYGPLSGYRRIGSDRSGWRSASQSVNSSQARPALRYLHSESGFRQTALGFSDEARMITLVIGA